MKSCPEKPIDLSEIPALTDQDSPESYPEDWYSRKDRLRSHNDVIYGNWVRPASAACDAPWSKPIERRYIRELTVVGFCDDGVEIVRALLSV